MQRRSLLALGIGGAALLAVAGGAVALLQPAREAGKLGAAARMAMTAVARAVLLDILPAEPAARLQALQGHITRLEATIAGMPRAMQDEVDQLLALLASAPGRVALAGLASPWDRATDAELAAALQGLRVSRLALRQQAFHALRDLTNAAYFAGPDTWSAIGYPGPRTL